MLFFPLLALRVALLIGWVLPAVPQMAVQMKPSFPMMIFAMRISFVSTRGDHLGRNYGLFTLSQRDHQANYLRRSTLLHVYDMIFTNAEHDADSIQENEKRIYHIKKEDKVVGQNLHLKNDTK